MNKSTDDKLSASGNAVNIDAIAAHHHAMMSGMTDTIDFSDDIPPESVIELDKEQTARLTSGSGTLPKVSRDSVGGVDSPVSLTEEPSSPVRHKESTLLVDSPLLALQEELDGERPRHHSDHKVVWGIAFFAVAVLITASYFIIRYNVMSRVEGDVEVAEAEPEGVHGTPFERRLVPLTSVPSGPLVLVNGVSMSALSGGEDMISGVSLVEGADNSIALYADGYVPILTDVSMERDFFEEPLEYELVSSDTYQMSSLIIRAPKKSVLSKTILYVNGQAMMARAEQRISVVSGFPAFIHVREEGKGDHLEVVWPTRHEETVELPELESVYNARRVTRFNIDVPRDYTSDRTFVLGVTAEGQTTTTPGTRRIAKNELIRVTMNKEGRYPLAFILDSTPFGSISVSPYMQLNSRGIARVSFHRKSESGITLCFRRASESVCTQDGGETIVPSGKWELVAYREQSGGKVWFKSSAYEVLQPGMDYVFSLKSKGENFQYSIVKSQKSREEG